MSLHPAVVPVALVFAALGLVASLPAGSDPCPCPMLVDCLQGPGITADCVACDYDLDLDVDLADAAAWQIAWRPPPIEYATIVVHPHWDPAPFTITAPLALLREQERAWLAVSPAYASDTKVTFGAWPHGKVTIRASTIKAIYWPPVESND